MEVRGIRTFGSFVVTGLRNLEVSLEVRNLCKFGSLEVWKFGNSEACAWAFWSLGVWGDWKFGCWEFGGHGVPKFGSLHVWRLKFGSLEVPTFGSCGGGRGAL